MNLIDIMSRTQDNIDLNLLQYFRQRVLSEDAVITGSGWTEHSFTQRGAPDFHREQGSPNCYFVVFKDIDKIMITLWNGGFVPTNTRCYWDICFKNLEDDWLDSQHQDWIGKEAVKQFEQEEMFKRNKRIVKIAQDLRNKLNFAPNKGETK